MVQGTRKPELVAELVAGANKIISGIPAKQGGGEEGLNPHELIEAALAACSILTVQMYANRKGYALESTDVTVKIESEGKESKISRKVSFRGALSEEEKTRLMEIVNKCPIHKLLESQITIETARA